MKHERLTTLVVCPGRGTYNAPELGYLAQHHAAKATYLELLDNLRTSNEQESITALDARHKYSTAVHTRGDNASLLINACAYCDFLDIDQAHYEVVAITGNSLGWYTALGCAGALDEAANATLVNTMGTLMHERLAGAQLIYPLVDENWRPVPGRVEALRKLCDEIAAKPGRALHVSIELGGMILYGGDERSIRELEKRLEPEQERFPFRLRNHAAFHTPLQEPIKGEARRRLSALHYERPGVALVDGRGKIWASHSTDVEALHDYTLGHQLVNTYRFTKAIEVAVKEFAPQRIIILGPGNTLGGATAQSLIAINWQGWRDKSSFKQRQAAEPYILSMGVAQQRQQVVKR